MLTGLTTAFLRGWNVEQSPLQRELLLGGCANLIEVIVVFVERRGIGKEHFSNLGIIAPAAPFGFIERKNVQHSVSNLPVGGANFTNQGSARLRRTVKGVHLKLDSLLGNI